MHLLFKKGLAALRPFLRVSQSSGPIATSHQWRQQGEGAVKPIPLFSKAGEKENQGVTSTAEMRPYYDDNRKGWGSEGPEVCS